MAMQSQDLPIIVLVQGAFRVPQVYEKLVHLLFARGYPTIHLKLPTCTDPESFDFPQRSLTDDAAAIHTELARLIQQEGKAVFAVMHSYGGLVGSEAVGEELAWSSRQARRQLGGVIHLFFFCAFVLDEGQSILGTFGKSPNPNVHSDGRSYILPEKLYNDLPPDEAALWESRLVAQSYKVQEAQVTRTAWKYIASTYLITENDQTVPPQYQEAFAKQAGATVERCSSGHSPQLSQPEMLVQKIIEASMKAMAAIGRQTSES
ncbi:MAG: hypothetical protein Q9208_001179 [Pyrenodesmia sp. 3 TL-2023]